MIKKSNVCDEAPVEMKVNGEKLVTFMCTPSDLTDLAVGHLYTRGILKNKSEIMSIAACKDLKMIAAFVSGKIQDEVFTIPKVVLSGCGSGTLFDEKVMNKEAIVFNKTIDMDRIKKVTRDMMDGAIMYKTSGGMHCAGIGNPEGEFLVREDIGRHNAVDKVIGAAINKEFLLEESIIVTTGRLSLDMVLKAVGAKIPVVASLSIPSSLSVELAEKLGICLIGRIGSLNPVIYTYENRIKK